MCTKVFQVLQFIPEGSNTCIISSSVTENTSPFVSVNALLYIYYYHFSFTQACILKFHVKDVRQLVKQMKSLLLYIYIYICSVF